MCARIRRSSGSAWEDKVGYSRLVRSGPFAEVSGTVAVDEDGNVHGKDNPYEQARYIFQKLRKILEDSGIAWEEVVRTRMYVTDMDHWPEVGRAHKEAFEGIDPTATMVEVAGLIRPDLLVEIELSAVSEAEHCYDYARPALTTDILLTRRSDQGRELLLIRRKEEPFKGRWALPGGFVEENETLEQCARRELLEETGISGINLNQFRAYSAPGRDPRGWTISVAFSGTMLRKNPSVVQAGDDAEETEWFPTEDLPPLAFDHAVIIEDYIKGAAD